MMRGKRGAGGPPEEDDEGVLARTCAFGASEGPVIRQLE
eukprot:COSAG01_NODE_14830_length_1405_cov_1.331547_1_plen_38_part_10